ncbi:MAG: hypothetical protein IJW53_06400 [Clostridia bacterium]|nr:hypothetical protein [Clostridia bacterium]
MANSLEKEYKKVLSGIADIKNELALLPDGYISEKTINGTKQYYLQRRIGKKVIGKHISSSELTNVRIGLSKRESLEKELTVIEERLTNIEAASKLVSHNLYKRILLLKACMPMEDLSTDEKVRASSFAEAMNAIEGIPATSEMKSNISAWHSGEISFLSLYEATLKKYGFPVDVR